MPPKKKKETIDWRKSDAKKLLYQDLVDGTIPLTVLEMDPADVHWQRPEYVEVPYDQFKDRLKDMRERISTERNQSELDEAGLARDRGIFPKQAYDKDRGYPRWEGSAAQKWLKKDVDDGKHLENYTPASFRLSREEYKEFPARVIGKHVSQEHELRKRNFQNNSKGWKKKAKAAAGKK